VGGPIALIEDGDTITIDAEKRSLDVDVSDAELEKRRAGWQAPPQATKTGVLTKYAQLVSSASEGAVTGKRG
jgi:dihydroxy-acid dehydratase